MPEFPTARAILNRLPALGRRLALGSRALTGVDEELLALVPTERPKYTALGGVVLGTAVIAAFSMTTALGEVLGGFQFLVLVLGLVWGAFVLNLDRWLVSSSIGTRWHRRVTVLLPRLVLAFFFGVVIAEPLVLRIFEPAIEKHIKDQRQQEVQDLTSVLLRCNPDPTADDKTRQAALGPDCADHRLNLEAAPAAMSQELDGHQKAADQLRADINGINTEQASRDALARNECVGTSGPGVTGKAGRGAECIARENEAQQYRSTHPTTAKAAQLAQLDNQISQLRAQLESVQRDYQATRDAAVKKQVDERIAHQGTIGLLERFRALDELTSTNVFLGSATWFIRLFFIGVDCLPVLVKLFGGVTRYEELVDIQATSAKKVYEQKVRTAEAGAVSKLRSQQNDAENESRKRVATSDQDLRWHEAQLEVELSQRVGLLAARMRQPTHREHGRRPPPHRNPRPDDTMPIPRTRV